MLTRDDAMSVPFINEHVRWIPAVETGQYRLLLIETDPVYREITAYRLELLGYSVAVAGDILSAWREIELQKPQAILMTLDDSRLDPMDLLEQFASDTDTASTPLLVMSSEADLDRVEATWRAGAVDYLVTPYDPVVLEKKITRLLQGVDPEDVDAKSVSSREQAASVEAQAVTA